MNLKRAREMFRRQAEEICRLHNRQPISNFVAAFERQELIKSYQELWPSWKSDIVQKVLQGLKIGKHRFILSVKGTYQGNPQRIWVIAEAATTAELRRFGEEKMEDIEQQLNLFKDVVQEIGRRSGRTPLPIDFSPMIQQMRRAILPPHHQGPELGGGQ